MTVFCLKCNDTASLPKVSFNFVSIANIENQPAEKMIGTLHERHLLILLLKILTLCLILDILSRSLTDVIGVVKNVEDLVTVNTKSNRQVNKRDINLVDDSERIVRLTLWGTNVFLFLKLFYN